MANACERFLKARDKLGYPVYLHYKGGKGFGTVLGGTCSFIVMSFFTLFVGFQIVAFFIEVDYNSETSYSYLSLNNKDSYVISIKDFLPSVAIIGPDFDSESTNIDEYWEVYWTQLTEDGYIDYNSVSCRELIKNMTDITEDER